MSGNRNPQQAQMADESMVRNLAAQAKALWPLEKPLFERYGAPARILDLACGTGEITRRLAELFPNAQITGVDVEEAHLNSARKASAAFGERLKFEKGDAFDLQYPDGTFIRSFVAAMIFGIVIGTYSSIFIAAPLLIYFKLRPAASSDEESETAEPAEA